MGPGARVGIAILLAATAAWAGDLEVVIETADGQRLHGTVRDRDWKLETAFGSAEIEADRVAAIRFGEPDVVTTTDGHELRGRLRFSSLRVATDDGRRTLRRDDLVSLAPAAAVSGSGFSGTWHGSWGPMQLEQTGPLVRGTYGYDDEFTIEGKVRGNELHFSYREPNARGEGVFTLWEDGDTFTGTFRADGGGDERFWGAYRHRPVMPEPRPGAVVEGQTASGLNFHLRVPADYDPAKRLPAIAFLHGSNMSARAYVDTIVSAWPEVAARHLLVGIDGERLSAASRDGRRAFNYTYVEFSGPEVGPRWRHRQSPALVAEALDELGEALPIDGWLVGGHSQGGFLSWALALFYPDRVRGAFPMSCGLLVQCEPDFSYFDDPARRAAQRAVALAPIHGERDRVVDFDSGLYAHERMQDGGFPALRLFRGKGGHAFAHLPVDEAVAWLDTMTCGDPERLVAFAEEAVRDERWRDATAAVMRAGAAGARDGTAERADAVEQRVDAAARADAAALRDAIRRGRDNRWVDAFWEFRASFAFTPAASDVMEAYGRLRERHAERADELFHAARRERDDDARKALYRELLAECYASKWWKLVSRLVGE